MPIALPISRAPRVAIILFLVMGLPGLVNGVSLPELNGLDTGPYAIGFKTIEKYDHSRTMRSPVDYFGNPITGEIARPVQICIWYPAISDNSDLRLVYGEYVFPYPEDSRFFEFLSAVQNREIVRLHNLLNMDRGLVLDLLSAETGAVRDAPPAEGQFPVVIYCGSRGSGVSENVGLFEYLASHGIIAAAIHSVGTLELTPAGNIQELETATRDLEFTIAALQEFAAADISRLALAGHELGAQAAIMTAARHRQVGAVIALAPFISSQQMDMPLLEHFSLRPERLTVPLLWVSKWDSAGFSDQFLSPLRYCRRTILNCDQATEGWLTHYALLPTIVTDSASATSDDPDVVYESLCKSVRGFLEASIVNNQSTVYKGGNGLEFATYMEETPLPPDEHQFSQIINTKGVTAAAEICRQFDLPRPDNTLMPEANFNQMGYRYFQQGDATSALVIFGWCKQAYPGSANACDSYADACLALGDTTAAVESLKKSLELLPADSTIQEQFRTYILENTPRRISELSGEDN